MLVDYNTAEKVCKYIELTGLTKFLIQRANTTGTYYSIYELINSDSNKTAVNEFKKFAEIVNENMAYKIILFDFYEQLIDENGNTKIKRTKEKTNKSEATFCFNNVSTQIVTNPTQNTNKEVFDYQNLRADIIKDIAKQTEENAILNEIKNLKLRFDAQEEEEEESNINGDNNQLSQILGLVNLFKSQEASKINGLSTDVKTNINTALKILYKNNKNLDTDLLKLADISEKNPTMFETLLTTLRAM